MNQQSSLQTFRITGMDCADCARGIERGVCRLEGVQSAAINFGAATLKVEGEISREAVTARVRELGYDVAETGSIGTAGPSPADAAAYVQGTGLAGFIRYLLQRRDTTLALVGAALILPGLIFNEFLPMLGVSHWLFDLTSILAWAVAGYPIWRRAWRSLRISHSITIDVLMSIAALGAVLIGAFAEAGLVMVLFSLGEALEGYVTEQARGSIRSLMDLAPTEATILAPCIDCREHLGRDGYNGGPCPFCGLEEKRAPVSGLRLSDVILVKPGERIPMDGRVVSGRSSVNQAPITGESRPVEKAEGMEVFAGSINGEGAIQIEVTHLAADNTISRLIRMVEEAQEQKAPVQRFVDRFAAIYTPAVVVAAALIAIVPPLVWGQPFLNPGPDEQGWLYRALALLVVACPCALVISTPVSLISAISNGARRGLLIKGGAYLEALSRVKAIAFDKTGTLTTGQPRLARVRAVDCQDAQQDFCPTCDDLLALTTAVERQSEHALAGAVVAAAQARDLQHIYGAAADVQALTGAGVRGRVQSSAGVSDILIASHGYFDARIPHGAHCADIAQAAAAGQTPMLVSADGVYLGYLSVTDSVREEARQTLNELRKLKIEHLVMLTGDDAATAKGVANEVGVTELRAGLLPEDKVAAVRELLASYGAVAMVGDGINDAPALATATVGIAMGAAGTAQALETANIALMNDSLGRLPFAVRLSRATMAIIHQNVVFSLGIKAVFLLLVLFGLGSMWLAVFADMGASLLVTLNGMRLLKKPSN